VEDQVLIVFEIEYNTTVEDMSWNNITIEDNLLLDVRIDNTATKDRLLSELDLTYDNDTTSESTTSYNMLTTYSNE